MSFNGAIAGGGMAAGQNAAEAKCPICRRWVRVIDGRLCKHGPGQKAFTCPGSGQEVK